jgi:predicted DNA-binding transcriptional regulator AlpA
VDEALNLLLMKLKPYLTSIVSDVVSSVLEKESGYHFSEKINVTQASELTGYSKNSLYQMHSKGQIPGALKVGGKLMFDTATLRNWVESGGRR